VAWLVAAWVHLHPSGVESSAQRRLNDFGTRVAAARVAASTPNFVAKKRKK